MKLTWYGHACFLLESDGGMRLLTDPYPQSIYPHGLPLCDAVTVSHEHYDHNDTASLPGTPVVFRGTGSHTLGDIRLQCLSSFHDEVQGAKRGQNTVFIFETGGLRLAHLGDLGHMPEGSLLAALQDADVLLLPIGGTYTLTGPQAAALAKVLHPRWILPMHYALSGCPIDISDESSFLKAMPGLPVMRHTCWTPALPQGILLLDKR